MSTIEVYNVKTKLIGFDETQLSKLKKKLQTYAPGYKYTHLFKMKKWDGKVTLLQHEEVLTGLLPIVVETYPTARIIDMRNVTVPEVSDTSVTLRPYQWDAIAAALQNTLYGSWWPRGVIKIATGGGKTEVAVALCEMLQVPTLFIVHRKELVEQARDRFRKYGIETGEISAGKLDLDHRVVVATIQSLMSFMHVVNKTNKRTQEQVDELLRKKAKRGKVIRRYLMGIEQVFIDEAHLCAATIDKGNLFTQALALMPHTYMRWGLTATPFMRGEYHDWLLEGTTGSTLYDISSKELIDQGYLANPKITVYEVKAKPFGKDWKADYDHSIVCNEKRNEMIIENIKARPGPMMVLVQRIAHGNLLKHMCDKASIPVRFLYGDIDLDERKEALRDLKSGLIKAVIGSTIWDEGLDVAEIRTLIIAGAGKSKVKGLQRLGRGLRLSSGKEEVEVVDFYERGSKWLQRHAVERMKLWKAEGYEVEIR